MYHSSGSYEPISINSTSFERVQQHEHFILQMLRCLIKRSGSRSRFASLFSTIHKSMKSCSNCMQNTSVDMSLNDLLFGQHSEICTSCSWARHVWKSLKSSTLHVKILGHWSSSYLFNIVSFIWPSVTFSSSSSRLSKGNFGIFIQLLATVAF